MLWCDCCNVHIAWGLENVLKALALSLAKLLFTHFSLMSLRTT